MDIRELRMVECELEAQRKYSSPEKIVEVACSLYIEKLGGWSFKLNQPTTKYVNIKGISDRIAIFPGGQVIFLELKAKSKQSYHQQKFQENITKYGGVYMLAHSVNEMATQLESIGIRLTSTA